MGRVLRLCRERREDAHPWPEQISAGDVVVAVQIALCELAPREIPVAAIEPPGRDELVVGHAAMLGSHIDQDVAAVGVDAKVGVVLGTAGRGVVSPQILTAA